MAYCVKYRPEGIKTYFDPKVWVWKTFLKTPKICNDPTREMYCKSQPSWENQDIFNCMHYEPKPKWNSKENSTIGCDIITKMVSFLHEPFYSALPILTCFSIIAVGKNWHYINHNKMVSFSWLSQNDFCLFMNWINRHF